MVRTFHGVRPLGILSSSIRLLGALAHAAIKTEGRGRRLVQKPI